MCDAWTVREPPLTLPAALFVAGVTVVAHSLAMLALTMVVPLAVVARRWRRGTKGRCDCGRAIG
jgi:hypothetical protein